MMHESRPFASFRTGSRIFAPRSEAPCVSGLSSTEFWCEYSLRSKTFRTVQTERAAGFPPRSLQSCRSVSGRHESTEGNVGFHVGSPVGGPRDCGLVGAGGPGPVSRSIKRRAYARRHAGRSCTNEERKRAALIVRRDRSTSPLRGRLRNARTGPFETGLAMRREHS